MTPFVPLLIDESVKGRRGLRIPVSPVSRPVDSLIPTHLLRKKKPRLPEMTEFQVVRHFTRLSQKNFSIDTNFYPLGSCTMKYNPKLNETMASLPGFAQVHPLAPNSHVQGILALLSHLETWLCKMTGFDAFTLNPAAGAHGELTGILIAQAYHRAKGHKKTTVLVPDSAHGTNPASAALANLSVVQVKSRANRHIDIDDFRAKLNDDVALVMITLPNTLGLFEENIETIAREAHAKGALLYMDGANFNALAGLIRPGDLGFDICHINLHKTFSTPHGGGGPGAGPVGVTKELEAFLPLPRIKREGDRFVQKDSKHEFPQSIGQMKSFSGNTGILIRAYTYMLALGEEGLKAMSRRAIVNANFIRVRLSKFFKPASDEPCMHEAVFSGVPALKNGVRTLDIAKRLLDYGFYAPTVYFPLIVPECLMIEPTETETPETLDDFCNVIEKIVGEIDKDPEFVKHAPYTTPVRRLDEVKAAREPHLRWESWDEVQSPLVRHVGSSVIEIMSFFSSTKAREAAPLWLIRQDNPLNADLNMEIDAEALRRMLTDENPQAIIRLFEWNEIAISYGYLMEERQVRVWANSLKSAPLVKRPTGGGAVLHYPMDLSLSLLWPRGKNLFPEQPRAAYERIHSMLLEGMEEFLGKETLQLYLKDTGGCKDLANPSPFPWDKISVRVCFKEPVCNDVMLGEKKIIGGALRVTKGAFLYQGNIQMEEKFDIAALKTILVKTFQKHLQLAA